MMSILYYYTYVPAVDSFVRGKPEESEEQRRKFAGLVYSGILAERCLLFLVYYLLLTPSIPKNKVFSLCSHVLSTCLILLLSLDLSSFLKKISLFKSIPSQNRTRRSHRLLS